MAFYTRKFGLETYRYGKTRKDCRCFICEEIITKGQARYAKGRYL